MYLFTHSAGGRGAVPERKELNRQEVRYYEGCLPVNVLMVFSVRSKKPNDTELEE